MKCEKCERELIGDSVICNECGHDSSLRRAHETQSETHRHHSASSAISSASGTEANLIRFPKSANPVFTQTDSEADPIPVWRNEVRERVRQFREQRPEPQLADNGLADVDVLIQNPIVEAALKRLQKAPDSYAESEQGLENIQSAHSAHAGGHARAAATSFAPDRFSGPASVPSTAPSTHRETAGLSRPIQAHIDEGSSALRTGATHPAYASPATVGTQKANGIVPDPKPATPLQPLNPPVPATLWDRTLAGLFDFLLIAVACIPLYSIHSITGLQFGRSATYTVVGIAVWMTFLYQMWTMLLAGRTCGMAWRHLRVVNAENHDPFFPQWRLLVRSI
ncbi:MAG: RDD family protein, partial [Acidobacteriota bacterium]